nr:hypothetical protein [uncultured Hyphomonas sp.]
MRIIRTFFAVSALAFSAQAQTVRVDGVDVSWKEGGANIHHYYTNWESPESGAPTPENIYRFIDEARGKIPIVMTYNGGMSEVEIEGRCNPIDTYAQYLVYDVHDAKKPIFDVHVLHYSYSLSTKLNHHPRLHEHLDSLAPEAVEQLTRQKRALGEAIYWPHTSFQVLYNPDGTFEVSSFFQKYRDAGGGGEAVSAAAQSLIAQRLAWIARWGIELERNKWTEPGSNHGDYYPTQEDLYRAGLSEWVGICASAIETAEHLQVSGEPSTREMLNAVNQGMLALARAEGRFGDTPHLVSLKKLSCTKVSEGNFLCKYSYSLDGLSNEEQRQLRALVFGTLKEEVTHRFWRRGGEWIWEGDN